MVTYNPPPLNRRIHLYKLALDRDTDQFGQELDTGDNAPEKITVWANRRDTSMALEEVGDSSEILTGSTIWTIRERDTVGVEYLDGDDGRRYYLKAPARQRGGENAGMRARYLELVTDRSSGR